MTRAGWALLLLIAAGCGVKAPPRPPGASTAPPSALFKPPREPGPVAPEPIIVGPQAPTAPAPEGGAPAAPAAPSGGQEPKP